MKKVVLVALITVSSLNVFSQAKKKTPVDGRIYSITLVEDTEKKKNDPIKDDFSFMPGGKFKSNYMLQAQFPQAEYEYEVDSVSGTIKFTVESKTEDQGRFSWDAVIEGDNVSGTAIIRKKGKVVHSYTFKGTHKNKKKTKPAPKPVAPVAPATDSAKTGE